VPVYDFRCNDCRIEWEEYHEIKDRDNEWCVCGEKAERLIKFSTMPIIKEYFSENLNAQITGPAQRKRIMKERGVEEAG